MESTYNLMVLVVLFILLLLKLKNKFHRSRNPKLPPGPWQLPILGSIHHLLVGSQLPHRRFQELAKSHGPQLMHLKLGEVSLVVASSAAAAEVILKTHDAIFASRPSIPLVNILTYGGKGMGVSPYGEYYRQLRKIVTLELLSPKRVSSFRRIREEEAQTIIRSISQGGSLVNVSDLVARMANNVTVRASVGSKVKDQDGFIEAMLEGLRLAAGLDMGDLFPSMSWLVNLISRSRIKTEKIHEKLDQMLESIVQERKERKMKTDMMMGEESERAEGLVDVLLRLQKEGGLPFELTDVIIKALILDIFAGGSETTSATLQWSMSELMKNPRVMRKAQTEIRDALRGKDKVTEANIKGLNYLHLVIKETLRLHPPVPLLLPRECQSKCELLGYEIPEKTRVVVNAWAIGRDPRYWEDAEEFKPERFEGNAIDFKGTNFELLPFGAGRRVCPGMLFGLAAVELPLAILLHQFDWELPEGIQAENLDMSESFGATAHRKSDLILRVTSHSF